MTAIELDAAEKTFANGLHALAPLTLSVGDGDFATIVGPSGCGKSTLLRMVAGLTPPSSGRARLWPDRSEADDRRVAFVFQSATLMAWADVERNVRLPLDLGAATRDRTSAAARVDRALTLVG